MTQTTSDIGLSLDGLPTAANVRPEEAMGDGQGWVYVLVDDVHGPYERAARRSHSSTKPDDAFGRGAAGYSARDRQESPWSFGTMSPGAEH
jgi:hypothetical protein